MKLGDLIQRVQSMYSHGVQSDDSRLSGRHIYSKLVSARARLIEKELKSGRGFTAWSMQLLPCVELVEALFKQDSARFLWAIVCFYN